MNKILIIVDMQTGFVTNNLYNDLKIKLNDYIKTSNYDYYIFTKFKNKQNSLYTKKLNWNNLLSNESQEICVHIPKNSLILDKYGYGISEQQIRKIKELNIGNDEIDICGLQTDACVYAIALQLFDNGIFPNILINYVATSPKRTKTIKEILIHQFGKVDERE